MAVLLVGVVLFMGAHLVPSLPRLRSTLRERLGVKAYMALFSLVSALGFILIIVGVRRAPFAPVWNPPAWGREVAIFAMPLALILFVGAYLPSNLKRVTRHPMLWGVTIWAAVHLLSNGDRASLILFGSFGAFALFDMWSANRRGAELSTRTLPRSRDALLLVVGGIVYAAILTWHDWLFGMPVLYGI